LVKTTTLSEKSFMATSGDYLKTQTVARALGLGVSTVKRWVDAGSIKAVRTAGKHRLIPRAEAIRVARGLGIDPTVLLRIEGIPSAEFAGFDETSCDRLCQLFREGKSRQASVLIHSIYNSGCGAVTLADQVIRPAMTRIGHGWMAGILDIYEEHQASHVVASALTELIARVAGEQPASGPLALGATTEGDPYVLSSLLAELALREMGWEVRNLGVNLPLRSLANATLQYRPKLVVLSINYLRDPDGFVGEYRSFYETATRCGTAVILGGQALVDDLRSRLVYTAFGDRMIILAEFARRLAAVTSDAGQSPAEPEKLSFLDLESRREAAQ
jgi:excisionase family DNA binding protein